MSAAQLHVYEDVALIDPADGFIWFDRNKKAVNREWHNVCEILLSWESAEEYGVQRIRHGSLEPQTRAQWRKQLRAGLLTQRVSERIAEVSAVFPGVELKFRVLGWHMLTVKFLRLGRNDRVLAPLPAARVTTIGQTDYLTSVAEKSNEE